MIDSTIPRALKVVGFTTGTWALFVVIAASITYYLGHPDFSIFRTYLSDVGDSSGWPQIIFNSGTLIAAPMRYLIVVLVALQLYRLGADRSFVVLVLFIGLLSCSGTVFMTAIPFSLAPSIHKTGIVLYFIGTILLQTLIFLKEWSLKNIPKVLPVLSLLIVLVFFVFALLLFLYEQEVVSRSTPVIWEWMCFFISIVWVFIHSILLGKEAPR